MLNKLGLCSSYYSVQLYEASAIVHSSPKIDDEAFVQFVFDNADHNIMTLDGLNTWHCMGGICCVTPGDYINSGEDRIPKLKRMPTAAELAAKHAVKVIPFESFDNLGLQNILYEDISNLRLGELQKVTEPYCAYLWAKKFGINEVPIWRGFMEKLSFDSPYNVSRIKCLPFINQPPSELSTINTALHMAVEKSQKIGQKTCFVTFDQPL